MNVLITGGSGGLGQALCYEFESRHYTVYTIGRDGCHYNIDLGDTLAIAKTISQLPSIDIVIHAAGKNMITPHHALMPADISEMVRVNAISNFTINRLLKEQGSLKISCHIISDAAWTPMTHSLAYNVSKAAQLMLMRQMAHEEKSYIIFGVSPGKIHSTGMSKYIDSTFPMLRGMDYEEGRKYQLSRLKTGEMAPDRVARFIYSLVDNCDKHFHGHNFSIGG